jgi:hypothetical protein
MFKFYLTLAVFCVIFYCGASNDVQSKFIANEIVPDVLDSVAEIEVLRVSYPSGVSVNLGNVLTPTQVKDQPTIEYEGDAGAFYTLLMTGELRKKTGLDSTFISPPKIPTHLLEAIQSSKRSDIGWW